MRRRADRTPGGIDEKPDAELIAEVHQPGSDALSALFRRYGRLVQRVAANILRDDAEAEDVAQEVFLEIYRKSHLYDPSRGAVRVWLLQYAYRRSIRRKDVLRRRAAYGGEPLEGAESLTASKPPELSREECQWVLRTGLAKLTNRQRTTLELACLQEFSLRDVAQRMSVSLGSARHYYYRGLARLRAWAASHDVSAPRPNAPETAAEPRPVHAPAPRRSRATRASARRGNRTTRNV